MLRIDLLIDEAREGTENSESTSETGVQDSEFLRAFNDGQDKIHSKILAAFARLSQKEKEIDAVSGQEVYDLPADVLGTTMIEVVEYSRTGQAKDYYQLDSGILEERVTGNPGTPAFYVRRSNQILIQPAPAGTGKFRVTYQKVIPRLDKRRGRVLSVTLDTATRQVTALTLDPTSFTTDDVQRLNQLEFITIIGKTGTIKMKGIPITEVNSSTGVVTIEAFTYEVGETIAVGDYVVAGAYSTTHSELPDNCERFLLSFCKWRILKRDSSQDQLEENKELMGMLDDILETFAKGDSSVKYVPILDGDFLVAD